jgi:hypothetical protein
MHLSRPCRIQTRASICCVSTLTSACQHGLPLCDIIIGMCSFPERRASVLCYSLHEARTAAHAAVIVILFLLQSTNSTLLAAHGQSSTCLTADRQPSRLCKRIPPCCFVSLLLAYAVALTGTRRNWINTCQVCCYGSAFVIQDWPCF